MPITYYIRQYHIKSLLLVMTFRIIAFILNWIFLQNKIRSGLFLNVLDIFVRYHQLIDYQRKTAI